MSPREGGVWTKNNGALLEEPVALRPAGGWGVAYDGLCGGRLGIGTAARPEP